MKEQNTRQWIWGKQKLLILLVVKQQGVSLYYLPTAVGPGELSPYSDSLQAGRSGDRILVGARVSAPVQTGAGAHPASCTMATGSSGRGVALTTHQI
jgi:hypothetical protein